MSCVGKLFMKTLCLEVVKEDEGGVLVQNQGKPDDRWWIEWEVFSRSYPETIKVPLGRGAA